MVRESQKSAESKCHLELLRASAGADTIVPGDTTGFLIRWRDHFHKILLMTASYFDL